MFQEKHVLKAKIAFATLLYIMFPRNNLLFCFVCFFVMWIQMVIGVRWISNVIWATWSKLHFVEGRLTELMMHAFLSRQKELFFFLYYSTWFYAWLAVDCFGLSCLFLITYVGPIAQVYYTKVQFINHLSKKESATIDKVT